jgi:hypothetical protein
MPRDGSIEYGTDFVRIYKCTKILRKNNPEKDFYKDTSFSELVLKESIILFFSIREFKTEIKLFLFFVKTIVNREH